MELSASLLAAAVLGLVVIVAARFGIKGLVLRLLRLYKASSLAWLKLRGLTPTDVVERRVVSGESWEEFCDTLKAAGATMLAAGTPKDPFNQVHQQCCVQGLKAVVCDVELYQHPLCRPPIVL